MVGGLSTETAQVPVFRLVREICEVNKGAALVEENACASDSAIF